MKEKLIKILLVVMGLTGCFKAQFNLVPNPSFETFTNCPTTLSMIGNATGWSSYRGSPDYYNACNTSSNSLGVPNNLAGYQNAQDGEAFAGLVAYSTGGLAREYMGAQLVQTLSIGQTYFVSFYVSLAEYNSLTSQYLPCNKIGTRFSTVPFQGSDFPYPGPNASPINNFAHVITNTIISDTLNWTKIQGSFVADSAYKYIAIGNFFDDANTDTIYRPNGIRSYFFIDNICVSTSSTSCLPPITQLNETELNNEVNIFPNPVNSLLHLELKTDVPTTIFIYNSLNELVYEEKFSTNTLCNVSAFKEGVYYVKVVNNNYTLIKRVIINH